MRVEERLARLEEIAKMTQKSVFNIEKSLPKMSTEIALLKRDAKWHHRIVVAVGAFFGAAAGFLAEIFRR